MVGGTKEECERGASIPGLGICRCFAFSSRASEKGCDGAFFSFPFGRLPFSLSLSSLSSITSPPKKNFPVSANLIAKEDIVNLERGCVCCSLRSDLVDAFTELDRRSSSGGGTKFDNVLVETTGVADPGPVVSRFSLLARFLFRCFSSLVWEEGRV